MLAKSTSVPPCPFTIHSLLHTWASVTLPELKKFLGLMFVTRIIDKPNLKLYWTEYPIFETPIFSKTMARNHFESILPFLHFSDSSLHDTSRDRLYKISPILERLSDKFSMVYIPEQ
jgi:hypothetical protein